MSPTPSRNRTVAVGVLWTVVSFVVLIPVLWKFAGPGRVGVGFVVTSVCGGAAAGYRTAGHRKNGAVNGVLTGLLAGFVIGFVGTTVVLVGSRYHPPVSWTFTELLVRAVPAGVVVGAFFGTWGTAGWVARPLHAVPESMSSRSTPCRPSESPDTPHRVGDDEP